MERGWWVLLPRISAGETTLRRWHWSSTLMKRLQLHRFERKGILGGWNSKCKGPNDIVVDVISEAIGQGLAWGG